MQPNQPENRATSEVWEPAEHVSDETVQNPEVWEPVLNFPAYEVSTLGRVRTVSTGYIKNQRPDRRGDPRVSLGSTGRKRPLRIEVSKLVLCAFSMYEPGSGWEVIHLDGDRTNNALDNLDYKETRRAA